MFGETLVSSGLRRGLGHIMELSVSLYRRNHPGTYEDAALQAWVACGSAAIGSSDPEYWWYQVGACAMRSGTTVAGCVASAGMPADRVREVRECTDDAARVATLVDAMHRAADRVRAFPSATISGRAFPASAAYLISEVCREAAAAGAHPLPAACPREPVPPTTPPLPPPRPTPRPAPSPPSPPGTCPAQAVSDGGACMWVNGTNGVTLPPAAAVEAYCDYFSSGSFGYLWPSATGAVPCPEAARASASGASSYCLFDRGNKGVAWGNGATVLCSGLKGGRIGFRL